MPYTEKLKDIITGEVDDSSETKLQFSKDASIFQITPEVVVSPQSVEDLQALVRFATAEKQAGKHIALTPRAGGTDMTGSSIGESIVLNYAAHLNHIGAVENNQVTVQPGVYFRDLEKATLAQNLIMPAYPVSKMLCGVGGMVGNNSGGEKSLAYGQVRNFIQNIKAVLADGKAYSFGPLDAHQLQKKLAQTDFEGTLYKNIFKLITQNEKVIRTNTPSTSKNSSGYYIWDVWNGKTFDLTKLLVGSQGTLGLFTEITFSLVPVNPHKSMVVFFMHNLEKLGELIHVVTQYKPESFELFDDHTLSLAMQYLPEMMEKMGGKSLSLLWQFLPELKMIWLGGKPKLILLAEFTGQTETEAKQKAQTVQTAVQKQFFVQSHITGSETESKKYWTIRRESYNLLRNHTKGKISACFIEDICVHPDQLPEFLPKLHAIFARYPGFIYTIAGHAGDANFHIMPLMNLADDNERKIVTRMANEVFALVRTFRGTISAEHNDGLVRGPFLHTMFSEEMLEIFRQIKKTFDPLDIFNPGRKIEANLQDFNRYMRKS